MKRFLKVFFLAALMAGILLLCVPGASAEDPFTVVFPVESLDPGEESYATITSSDPSNTIQDIYFRGAELTFESTGDHGRTGGMHLTLEGDRVEFYADYDSYEGWIEINYTDKDGNDAVYNSKKLPIHNNLRVDYEMPADYVEYSSIAPGTTFSVRYKVTGVSEKLTVCTKWWVFRENSNEFLSDKEFEITKDSEFTATFTPDETITDFDFDIEITNAKGRLVFTDNRGTAIPVRVPGEDDDNGGSGPNPGPAVQPVDVSEANFPDPVFREYVKQFDTNVDGVLSVSEIETVNTINVEDLGISSLKGIGYFVNLGGLYCENNNLTSLDLSGNPYVSALLCEGNRLASLDLSNTPHMMFLHCSRNNISSIDVSACEALVDVIKELDRTVQSTPDGDYDGWVLPKGQPFRGDVSADFATMFMSVDCNVTVYGGGAVSAPSDRKQSSGTPAAGGLQLDPDGVWRLYENGVFISEYTGLYCDANLGWWLVQNGTIAFDYNGLYGDPNFGWWLVQGGGVNFSYSGLFCDPYTGWWLLGNGTVAFDYNGLWYDEGLGWWLVRGGAIDFSYNGLWNDPNLGWWLIGNGTVAADYTGLYCDPNVGWWLVNGGQIAFDYTGLWNDPNYGWWLVGGGRLANDYNGLWNDANLGWVLVQNGALAPEYNGLYCDPNLGWWLIGGGRVAFDYNGLWCDPNYGWWLVSGGTINWSYTGGFEYNGSVWNIVNGQLVF